tara:strand:- start:1922 stop:3466 length:1545 start_codon:yes stop_codon:yes gene_type:complete
MNSNNKGLFVRIKEDIEGKLQGMASNFPDFINTYSNEIKNFFKNLTKEPTNYASFVSIIYIIIFFMVFFKYPYNFFAFIDYTIDNWDNKWYGTSIINKLNNNYGEFKMTFMLLLFFFMFITYCFISQKKGLSNTEGENNGDTTNKDSWWGIFVKKVFAFMGTVTAVICLILFTIWIVKKIPQVTNITSFVFKVLSIAGAGALVFMIFKKYLDSNQKSKNVNFLILFLILIKDVIFYIPCLLISFVEYIKGQFKITTKTEWLVLGGEIVFIALAFIIPYIYQKIITHDGNILLENPHYLNNQYQLGHFQSLTPYNNDTRLKYNYSISGWFNIFGMGPNTRSSYSKFVDIINYANKPAVQYNASTNTLRIQTEIIKQRGIEERDEIHTHNNDSDILNNPHDILNNPHDDIEHRRKIKIPIETEVVDVYSTNNILLQKWHNIVINYDEGNIDVFLNGELVGTKSNISPHLKYDLVTCGQNKGVEGGICNVTYYNRILNNGEIVFNYKLLSQRNPPLL